MEDPINNTEQAATVAAYFASIHQGRTKWWGWLLGFILIIAASFIGMMLMSFVFAPFSSGSPLSEYIFLLATFLPIFFAILLIYKIWHELPIKALLTSAPQFRWGNMWRTIAIIFVAYIALSLIEYRFFPQEYEGMQIQTDIDVYLKLLVITLILVPFQATAEELLCRGYLNQALIKYLRSPWAVFLITSAGFAWLHAANPEAGGQMGPYLASIFLFGMAMCVLLYFEGGIESAIGAHIANNIFVFALLGYEDPILPNTAFFTLGEPVIAWSDFAVELGMMIVLIAVIIWANRKWGRAKS